MTALGIKKQGGFSLNVITGTYQRPPVTLLLGTEVSQRSYFCSWFRCSGQCWQKVSLRFPQWKRTGWASSVQHTPGGLSCSCQSGRKTQSAAVLPWLSEQPEEHAAGMVRVPPHPCPGDPRQRCEEQQRRPAHSAQLLAADHPGTGTYTPCRWGRRW